MARGPNSFNGMKIDQPGRARSMMPGVRINLWSQMPPVGSMSDFCSANGCLYQESGARQRAI